jgi:hypothetical protein
VLAKEHDDRIQKQTPKYVYKVRISNPADGFVTTLASESAILKVNFHYFVIELETSEIFN